MTALAGLTGPGASQPACRTLLSAQAAYGGTSESIATDDWSAIGISSADPGMAVARDGQRWIAAGDLRLDNRADLLRLAGRRGGADRLADMDLLLKLWSRHGEDTLQHLVGDYAFAIYDRLNRTLLLARDPTGQRPLFFRNQDDQVAFASMPAALRPLYARPSGLDARMLAGHLANIQHPGSETFFEHVERVRPGELIRFEPGRLSRRIYWNPSIFPTARRDAGDLVEAYRSLLDSAVACRIGGDGPVGSHLSAGFDSSAVTGTAARLAEPGRELVAFTAAPLPGEDCGLIRHRFRDESLLAAGTARMHGLQHVIVRHTDALFDVVRRQTLLVQAPLWDPINACWWSEIRKRASDRGIATILTGEAGNLTISAGGLATLAAYLRRAGDWTDWWREARAAKRRLGARWRGIAVNSFGAQLPDFAWSGARRLFLGIPGRGERSFLQSHWVDRLDADRPAIRPSGDPYADRLRALRLGDLGPYRQAALADRGVAELDPTADRRLIEFSLRLPPEQLLRDGVAKPLARAALADRVPPAILNSALRGMQGADWHRRINARSAREVLEEVSPNPLFRELIDVARLEAAIQSWPSDGFNAYRPLLIYRGALTNALATGLFINLFNV